MRLETEVRVWGGGKVVEPGGVRESTTSLMSQELAITCMCMFDGLDRRRISRFSLRAQ
jgi:hypothetical protein